MKILTGALLLVVVTAVTIPTLPGSEPETEIWRAEIGEDATSSFFYFSFRSKGADSFHLHRILWNGGAQNEPETTDFELLSDSSIRVIQRSFSRTSLSLLIAGELPAPLNENIRMIDLDSLGSSESDSTDLRNLIHVISVSKTRLP